MKDNIDSKSIGNRKFVIELRFDHKVTLSDKKGAIIENIKALGIFVPLHWEIGVANATIWDGEKKENARNIVIIELNRLCYISSKIDSVDCFYSNFSKIYDCVENELGVFNIRRIGCRIQGTYKTKSADFDTIIEKIKKGFPSQFYLQDFPATDLLFQLNYKNGMYNVGPVKEDKDAFIEQNFAESYRIKHVGIAIDTDNYLTNEKEPINDKSLIKDTYILSLSVEKQLFENLKEL